MSLALALRGYEGLVLAADSRATKPTGASEDTSEKFLQINRDTGVLTFGLKDPGYIGIAKLVEASKAQHFETFEVTKSRAQTIFQQEYQAWLPTGGIPQGTVLPPGSLCFIIGGYDAVHSNQFRVVFYTSPDFVPQDIQGPTLLGARWNIAQSVVDFFFYPEMAVGQLARIAVLALTETMAIDLLVGGPIQLATITWSQGFHKFSEDEILALIKGNQALIGGFCDELNSLFME